MKAKFYADGTYSPRITEFTEDNPAISLNADGQVKVAFKLKMDGRPYKGDLIFTIRDFEHLIADYNALKLEGISELRKALAGLK